jgi:hypothetical protein
VCRNATIIPQLTEFSCGRNCIPSSPWFNPRLGRYFDALPRVARIISANTQVSVGKVGAQPNTNLFEGLTMSAYQNDIKAVAALKEAAGSSWSAINPESVARMRAQNRFQTGLDIARYTAGIMRGTWPRTTPTPPPTPSRSAAGMASSVSRR